MRTRAVRPIPLRVAAFKHRVPRCRSPLPEDMKMRVQGMNSAALLALALTLAGPAAAATVWDESVNGDLSNDPLAPTSVGVAPGLNDVIGSAGAGSPSFDPITGEPNFDTDFFTFTVPTGYQLKSLVPVSIAFTDPRDMDS